MVKLVISNLKALRKLTPVIKLRYLGTEGKLRNMWRPKGIVQSLEFITRRNTGNYRDVNKSFSQVYHYFYFSLSIFQSTA